jgi:hypothetical protein
VIPCRLSDISVFFPEGHPRIGTNLAVSGTPPEQNSSKLDDTFISGLEKEKWCGSPALASLTFEREAVNPTLGRSAGRGRIPDRVAFRHARQSLDGGGAAYDRIGFTSR